VLYVSQIVLLLGRVHELIAGHTNKQTHMQAHLFYHFAHKIQKPNDSKLNVKIYLYNWYAYNSFHTHDGTDVGHDDDPFGGQINTYYGPFGIQKQFERVCKF
jgi:hypothetical protein